MTLERVLVFLAATLIPLTAAQTSGFSATLTGGYETGTTPTQLDASVTFTTGISANGDTVVLIFDVALLTAGSSPTVSVTGGTSPVFSSTSVNTGVGGGKELTLTLNTGSIGAADTVSFSITDNFVVLPSGTPVMLTATSTGDTAGTSVEVFRVIAGPSVTLNTPSLFAGNQPTLLQVSWSQPFALTSGSTLKLTGSVAIFTASVTTGLTLVGASSVSYTTNSLGTTFTIITNANIAVGTSVDLTLASGLLALVPSTAGAVTIDTTAGGATVATGTTGYGTIIVAGGSGADPIARFGDKVLEFELPPYELTSLVNAPDMKLFGSVFEGQTSAEQWFDRMVITSTDEQRFMELQIKPNLHAMNHSKAPKGVFNTLDVKLGYGHHLDPTAVTQLHQLNSQVPLSFMGLHVAFRSVARNDALKFTTIGGFRRECVDMAGSTVHMYICSSPADEYYGKLRDLSLKFAHLDMVFVEIKDSEKLTGVLPELWGLQPMSETTRGYVKEEKLAASSLAPSSNFAFAGGVGMEEIEKECRESADDNNTLTV